MSVLFRVIIISSDSYQIYFNHAFNRKRRCGESANIKAFFSVVQNDKLNELVYLLNILLIVYKQKVNMELQDHEETRTLHIYGRTKRVRFLQYIS